MFRTSTATDGSATSVGAETRVIVVSVAASSPTCRSESASQLPATLDMPREADASSVQSEEEDRAPIVAECECARREDQSDVTIVSGSIFSEVSLVGVESAPDGAAVIARGALASGESARDDVRSQEASASQSSGPTHSPPMERDVTRDSSDEYVDPPACSRATVDPPTEKPLVRPDKPP